jgi:hypothetical protein
LVEAELRAREREVRALRAELNNSRCLNQALVNELQARKQEPAVSERRGETGATVSEQHAAAAVIKQIVLGRQTGGYDEDGTPGDEGVQVVLEPRDRDGRAIKAAGVLHVDVLEITPQGTKSPIGNWDVAGERLEKSWKSGLLSTGYFVSLPWQTWPTSKKLRVVARFTLGEGAVFEADKDIIIRLGKPGPRQPPAEATEPGPQPRSINAPAGPQAKAGRQGWADFFQLTARTAAPPNHLADAARILPPVTAPE